MILKPKAVDSCIYRRSWQKKPAFASRSGKIERADILITESTYGNRFHKDILDVGDKLEKVVIDACKKEEK